MRYDPYIWPGKAFKAIGVFLSFYVTQMDEWTGKITSIHYTDDGFGNLIVCDENKERTFRYSYTH